MIVVTKAVNTAPGTTNLLRGKVSVKIQAVVRPWSHHSQVNCTDRRLTHGYFATYIHTYVGTHACTRAHTHTQVVQQLYKRSVVGHRPLASEFKPRPNYIWKVFQLSFIFWSRSADLTYRVYKSGHLAAVLISTSVWTKTYLGVQSFLCHYWKNILRCSQWQSLSHIDLSLLEQL